MPWPASKHATAASGQRPDPWASRRVRDALEAENTGSESGRRGAITGRFIAGLLRRGGRAI